MATARREVVRRRLGNVTPKLHLLEDHIVLCIRRFGVGLGLLGEQGGEGLHHEMNIVLGKLMNIPNDLDRLKKAVENHCVATLPKHLPHIPVVASRTRSGRRTQPSSR